MTQQCNNVYEILEQLGLLDLIENFQKNDLMDSLELLSTLTDSQYEELGIQKCSDRIKIRFLASGGILEDETKAFLSAKLQDMGLSHVSSILDENGLLDLQLLPSVTDADLKSIGIDSMGARNRLLLFVKEYSCLEKDKYDAYKKAKKLMASEYYEEAKVLLSRLDSFIDSQELLEKCKDLLLQKEYGLAVQKMKSDDLVTVQTALMFFSSHKDYRDCNKFVEECQIRINSFKYQKALSLMEKGEYRAASQAFACISGWKDSEEKRKQCFALEEEEKLEAIYQEARDMMEKGDEYLHYAVFKFEKLGGYKDSSALAEKCREMKKHKKARNVRNSIFAVVVIIALFYCFFRFCYCFLAGHSWQTTSIEESTCTVAGFNLETCYYCKKTRKKELSLASHECNNWKIVVEPGCSTEGLQEGFCKSCGLKLTANVPATGHVYTVYRTTPPTCVEDGVQYVVCRACRQQDTQTIPAKGHTWKVVNEISSTCKTKGTQTLSCTECGASKTEFLELGQHSYVDYVCTVCGKENAPGKPSGSIGVYSLLPRRASYDKNKKQVRLLFSFFDEQRTSVSSGCRVKITIKDKNGKTVYRGYKVLNKSDEHMYSSLIGGDFTAMECVIDNIELKNSLNDENTIYFVVDSGCFVFSELSLEIL